MLFKARDHLLTSVVTSSEIKVAQLLKLVVNTIINPLTAIFDCKNGEVLEGPRGELIRLLIKEIGPIVRSLVPPESQFLVDDLDPQGKTLMFADDSLIRRARLTAIKTGANTSSMLQDVRCGRQTEIDYINGYVVSHGERLGRQCHNNKALVDMVRSRTVIKDNQIFSYFHT
jgi:2-dehydropantoate 2-reductase